VRSGLKELRRRIEATRKVLQITQALEKASAARMFKSRLMMEAYGPYARRFEEIVRGLIGPGCPHHPFLAARPAVRRVLVLAFSSDRGLCGGFNTELMLAANRFAETRPGQEIHFFVVGKVMRDRLRRQRAAVDEFFVQPRFGDYEDRLREIVAKVTQAFLEKTFDEAHMLYNRFHTTLRQEATLEQVLPMTVTPQKAVSAAAGSAEAWAWVPEFEPEAELLFERLLPEFVHARIVHAYFHSMVSENAGRSVAMHRATENAVDMIGELRMTYNRMRQDSITSEMIEITSGATA
jgi:F-type H+-transporting ATPase subunit gamma